MTYGAAAVRGTVYDLRTGNRAGRTDDVEGEFVAQVQRLQQHEECFVVVGDLVSEGFVDRLAAGGVPVVRDSGCKSSAHIVAGRPADWIDMKEGRL